jgi:hypothetical protein
MPNDSAGFSHDSAFIGFFTVGEGQGCCRTLCQMSSTEVAEEDWFKAELLGHVRSLEENVLKLPTGFFNRFLQEGDDWTFIIKTHALIESGTTRFLEAVVAPTVPPEFLQSLPLDGRHSKLRLLELLGRLEPDHVKFIKALSRVRNLLVHDVTQVGFVLTDYLASLSTQDVDSLISDICRLSYYPEQSKPEREKQRAKILAEPRSYIWRTALFYLAITSLRRDNARSEHEIEKGERERLTREADFARKIINGLTAGRRSGTNRSPNEQTFR